MRKWLAEPWLLLRLAAKKWSADHTNRLGASLAYYAIFSLGPLLLIAISVAGFVFGREAAQREILGTLGACVGESGARALEQVIASSRRHGTGWSAVAPAQILFFGTEFTQVYTKRLRRKLDSVSGGHIENTAVPQLAGGRRRERETEAGVDR
jgi:uncharacterized BrkB/YihY/UPF0761 family membrane protein